MHMLYQGKKIIVLTATPWIAGNKTKFQVTSSHGSQYYIPGINQYHFAQGGMFNYG